MYLEKIDAPQDLRGLTTEQLHALADEIREALLRKLSAHGGHIGPNLGMVEATIALHRVFDSPKDKIIYDVSHQSYVHKMLTGRREAFLDPADYDEVSGYTNPQESEHDHFTIGHTSTSVSLACGLAKARDLRGGSENVIAVIGDGSLSGGEAYEGLSNAGEAGTNLIVVVNDNEMSIAENHGGLYANLRELRESDGKAPCNFFRALGLDYLYVKEGNDIEALTAAFRQVKDTPRPVVVHIRTLKGKGYAPAERQKERFHWGMPFDLATGEPKAAGGGEDYCDLTGRFLLERMRTQPSWWPSRREPRPSWDSRPNAAAKPDGSSWTWVSPKSTPWRWLQASQRPEAAPCTACTAPSSNAATTSSRRTSASTGIRR